MLQDSMAKRFLGCACRCISSAPGSTGEAISFGCHMSRKRWPKGTEPKDEGENGDVVGSGWTRGAQSSLIVPPETAH